MIGVKKDAEPLLYVENELDLTGAGVDVVGREKGGEGGMIIQSTTWKGKVIELQFSRLNLN